MPLTFGVEFEFVICTALNSFSRSSSISSFIPQPPKSHIDDDKVDFSSPSNWEACAKLVARTLSQNGIPAEFTDSVPHAGRWQVKEDASIFHGSTAPTPYGPGGDCGRCSYLGFEVVSPVLTAGDENCLKQVFKVAEILRERFRSFCDATTGLHVHVGNGNQGFPIDTLNKLIAFLYTFEPSISILHPPHRRRGRDETGNETYFVPLRSTIQPLLKKLSGKEIIDKILSFRSIEDLGMSMLKWEIGATTGKLFGPKARAYNLAQLIPGKFGAYKTVEFRQHEGCLDGKRVVLWIKFCVALMEFASGIGWKNLKTFLCKEIEEEEERTGRVKHVADVCHAIEFDEGRLRWRDVRDA